MTQAEQQRKPRVRGKTREERDAARARLRPGKRAGFYRDLIAATPRGSFERLSRVFDYIRAVAADLDAAGREEIAGLMARIADERNKP
jgi:hypothetical protein